jgi:hypothetical protein
MRKAHFRFARDASVSAATTRRPLRTKSSHTTVLEAGVHGRVRKCSVKVTTSSRPSTC